jgi:hypothetical protein
LNLYIFLQELDAYKTINNVNAQTVTKVSQEDKIKVSTDSDSNEFCLNTTGIIVTIAMFIVIQLIIAFVWYHLWQRKKKVCREKEEIMKKIFNPYAARS